MEPKPEFIIVCTGKIGDGVPHHPHFQVGQAVDDMLPIYEVTEDNGPNGPVGLLEAQQRLVNLNTIGRTER